MSNNWLPDWEKLLGDEKEGVAVEEAVAEPSVRSGPMSDEARPRVDLSEEGVMDVLKEVYDPELAIDIVNLGLVYGVGVESRKVHVRMTLTSPGCPMGPMIQEMVRGTIMRSYPEVEDVAVEFVWSPPWDPYNMASEEAKDILGIW